MKAAERLSDWNLFSGKGFFRGKKALSPLVATLILVVFALAIGTVTMNWGKAYVESIQPESEGKGKLIVIDPEQINSPLKQLQVDFLQGKINEEQYLERQKQFIAR
ncbi:hypothetical protein HYU14_02910 [Candidatus Woesearchaeota archaeon]|nr:hypothetical protein [Candidatus Woesearchaeota archaeon]